MADINTCFYCLLAVFVRVDTNVITFHGVWFHWITSCTHPGENVPVVSGWNRMKRSCRVVLSSCFIFSTCKNISDRILYAELKLKGYSYITEAHQLQLCTHFCHPFILLFAWQRLKFAWLKGRLWVLKWITFALLQACHFVTYQQFFTYFMKSAQKF